MFIPLSYPQAGDTPLDFAISYGKTETAELLQVLTLFNFWLLERGSDSPLCDSRVARGGAKIHSAPIVSI